MQQQPAVVRRGDNHVARFGEKHHLQLAHRGERRGQRRLVLLLEIAAVAAERSDRHELRRREVLHQRPCVLHRVRRLKQHDARMPAGRDGAGELQRLVLGEVAGQEHGAFRGGAVFTGPAQRLGPAGL